MISKDALDKFLGRSLKSYDWLKDLSEEELDKRIANLPVQLDFKIPLSKHQKVGFLIGAKKPSFLFFYDAGTGKSCMSLAILRYHKKLGNIQKTLILCPRTAHIYSWEDEIKLHAPDLTYSVLDDTTIGRAEIIDTSDSDVLILNYAGLVYLGTSYSKGNKKKNKKAGQVLDVDKIEWLISHFDSIVCDECFPYQTLVNTEFGKLPIGKIVEEQLNVRVWSFNHKTFNYELKHIDRFIKKPYKDELLEINHEFGKFQCTPNHRIFVEGLGYIEAEKIKSDDKLCILSDRICSKASSDKMLLIELRRKIKAQIESFVGRKSKNNFCKNWKNEQRKETSRSESTNYFVEFRSSISRQTGHVIFQASKRKALDWWRTWGQREDNTSAKTAFREIKSRGTRIPCKNTISTGKIQRFAYFIQSRYSYSGKNVSYRSRWWGASNKKRKGKGSEERSCFKLSGVENIKILESGNRSECRESGGENSSVYNLEIRDNNNYIANDVLVSNCHYISNHASLTYKIVNLLCEKARFRYGLTGTPFGHAHERLWSQFYAIDRGDTLGRTLGIFRAAFFNEKQNHFGGYEYTLKARMKDKLSEVIKNRSLWYSADECLTLPDKTYIKRYVSFPKEISAYYKKAIEDLKASRHDYKLVENIFLQMRMLSSAFISYKDSDGIKDRISFKDNPKLDLVIDLLNEFPEDDKVIIFNEFIYSGDILEAALKKEKIPYARLYSGTKKPEEEIRRFKEDKKCKVLICNSSSGGEGLNLQVSNRILFFELPVNPIIFYQAHKRVDRQGQNKKVFFYYLLMKQSFDDKMLKALQDGNDNMLSILEGL